MRRRELWGWITVAVVLSALAIPWFLWGDDTLIAGVPLWLWWHVGWMGLASIVFWLFAQRAWGIGIEATPSSSESEPKGQRRSSNSAAWGDEP
ncbi:DUF3311 domain-containing protein [Natrialba swarupiae]|uniref:DUF3311 domain-containing protein n=1 Tax=Natrialba swarupiae TaxID=2448032 RepID=A0A5D5AK33_9EURY|nr:DUF3311 domain-containing protein [Natrialba swarupiae]TYT62119.1 DUF3311 domain-containing protein [Natrialba swarupiae]